MARHRKDLGARKHVRVELHKPGFLIPAPEAALALQLRSCLEVSALSGSLVSPPPG